METLRADLRHALRMLRRSPGFAAAAIGMLALGLAATTAVFSVCYGILFKPLPYAQPEQLVSVAEVVPEMSKLYPELPANAKHYYTWRERCRSFAQLGIFDTSTFNLTTAGSAPERLGGSRVSYTLFQTLGVQPALGRFFEASEDRPKQDREIVISHSLWQRRFHGDRALVGRSVQIDGEPHLIVGVLPAAFRFPDVGGLAPGPNGLRYDVFKPIAFNRADLGDMGDFNYPVIARLRPGVSRERASAELNTIQAALTRQIAQPGFTLRASVKPLQEEIVGGSRRALLVLLGAIVAVLLIVCINLGNLMLARATARMRENAIRSALGAAAGRIVRAVLTESLLIALAGGVLGMALAYIAVHALIAGAPVNLPRLDEVAVDWRALLFALASSIVCGLLFGAIPAWRAAHSEPQDALRCGGRTATGTHHTLRASEILVGAEIALSATLLIAAGLLVDSFVHMLNSGKAFRAGNVLTVQLNLPAAKYKDRPARAAFVDRLLPVIRALPGVQAAGVTSLLPLEGETWVDMITRDDDYRPVFQRPTANYRSISPGYFRTLELPVLRGRAFEDADRNRDVAIVSATTAARIWPGLNAIGQHMRRGDDDEKKFWTVVGIVPDVPTSLQKPSPLMVYVPHWYRTYAAFTLVVRTGQDAASAGPSVRRAIWSLDSELPVPQMKTMRQVESDSVSERRFNTVLLAGFAACALLLAAIGLYGVISYSVNRRRNEIGIRMALGATAGDVRGMVLRQGLRPVVAGLLLGITGALTLGRLLQSLLFQVRANDPWVLAAVCIVLLATAALACFVPARRATRVDPASALRYD